ncbi:MAG: 4'-phosphopantetheinyl transferase superfamily protein [Erysipelotrichaceae bacterium]|nr:4'-phosphopantetheinyl transferase superfamily protein [Erysipelotrichaceae bacterium]
MAFLDIYVAKYPFECDENISCQKRSDEIKKCRNEEVKKQKFYVWKLLEFALQKSLSLDANSLNFIKKENGKWIVDKCYFSLSHSGNLVAVAISDSPVGIDIQKHVLLNITPKLLDLVLSKEEIIKYPHITNEKLLEMWSIKECAFKISEEKNFVSHHYTVDNFPHQKSVDITCQDELYKLSFLCDNISYVKYYYSFDGGSLCQIKNL